MSIDHNAMIAVIAAHRDGKEIQYRRHGATVWEDGAQAFNFAELDYRIKPEPPKPREWWLVWSSGSERPVVSGFPPAPHGATNVIHVREVLE